MYPTYKYYPQWRPAPEWVAQLATVFAQCQDVIDTAVNALKSDAVLTVLRPGLLQMGFEVENGKTPEGQLHRPVFFGENGNPSRQYNIDAYHPSHHIALEVEAGRATMGNAIYRDIIQTSLLVDVVYAAVAVPVSYRYNYGERVHTAASYRESVSILDAIYGGRRLELPFDGFLLIGY